MESYQECVHGLTKGMRHKPNEQMCALINETRHKRNEQMSKLINGMRQIERTNKR
jgi:hypothetical protein